MSTQITIVIVALMAAICWALWLIARYLRPQASVALHQPDLAPAKTLIVHTIDDQSLRGVQLPPDGDDSISLRDAIYLSPGGGETGLAGIVHVPLKKVAFVQEIALVKSSDKAPATEVR